MGPGGVEAFVQVADAGGFRAAARALGVTPSAVSKAVGRLEAELGVTLLARTTRSVRLTEEGAAYLTHARAALDALQAGRDAVAGARDAPRGTVRVSCSPVLAPVVMGALPRLLARHPGLAVDLAVTDRHVRVVHEGFDVVLRIGELDDSALVGTRHAGGRWVTAASPAYVARHGAPAKPADLADHAAVLFARPGGGVAGWRFAGVDGAIRGREVLRVDDGLQLVRAAEAGLGVAQLFDFVAADALAEGRLVELLAPWARPAPPIHALHPAGRERLPRVRVVLDALRAALTGPARP